MRSIVRSLMRWAVFGQDGMASEQVAADSRLAAVQNELVCLDVGISVCLCVCVFVRRVCPCVFRIAVVCRHS